MSKKEKKQKSRNSCLRDQDQLGHMVTFSYDGQADGMFRTTCGGCLTVILKLLTLTLLCFRFQKMISRGDDHNSSFQSFHSKKAYNKDYDKGMVLSSDSVGILPHFILTDVRDFMKSVEIPEGITLQFRQDMEDDKS